MVRRVFVLLLSAAAVTFVPAAAAEDPPPEYYYGGDEPGGMYWVTSEAARYAPFPEDGAGWAGPADYSDSWEDGGFAAATESAELCGFTDPAPGVWRGAWPYTRIVRQQTYWCWNDSVVTYRRSRGKSYVSGLCEKRSDPVTFKTAGGKGWPYAQAETQGEFGCTIFPPWTHYSTLYVEVRYNADGTFQVVRSGG